MVGKPNLRQIAKDPRAFVPSRLKAFEKVMAFPCVVAGRRQPEPAVFYRPDELLTTDADVTRRAIGRSGLRLDLGDVEEIDRLGIQRVPLIGDVDPSLVTRRLTDILPTGVAAAPHHVLSTGQILHVGPGSDPFPAEELPTPVKENSCQEGVVIVDTGLFDHFPTLSASDLDDLVRDNSRTEPHDIEQVDDDGNSVIDLRTAAHGGFIAGIIQTHLPGVPMQLERAVGHDGLIDEVSVALACLDGTRDKSMAVLNLSLGTFLHARSDLVALRAAVDRILASRPGVLLVCAAGNSSTDHPWYPAGWAAHRQYADAVVSVGALDTTGPRPRMANFSNHGSWVTAWAPGVDICSIYPTGVSFEYHDASGPVATLQFNGMAEWSGTSFAAPYAAAAILTHAANHEGMTPREAWADLRCHAGFVIL